MSDWYATTVNDQQGLVADENDGTLIASVYDIKHTRLIAAAPAMLRALKKLNDNWDLLPRDLQQVVVEAVEEAEDYADNS